MTSLDLRSYFNGLFQNYKLQHIKYLILGFVYLTKVTDLNLKRFSVYVILLIEMIETFLTSLDERSYFNGFSINYELQNIKSFILGLVYLTNLNLKLFSAYVILGYGY